MPSNYTGIPGVVDLTVALPIDSDSPSAQLFRTPYETLLNNDATIQAVAVTGIDGVNGGTYTPTNPIVINGDGLRTATEIGIASGGELVVESGGDIRIESGGDLTVEAGGQIIVDAASTVDVSGNINLTAGADINMAGGAGVFTMSAGVQLVAAAGAAIDLSGPMFVRATGQVTLDAGAVINLSAGSDVVIQVESQALRLCMTPTWIERIAGVPGWDMIGTPGTWVQTDIAARRGLLLPITLPPGDTLVSISIFADGNSAGGGGHVTIPAAADRLSISLIQVDFNGGVTVLATKQDDSVNAAAYDVPHTFTLVAGSETTGTMPQVLSVSFAYYILIEGEDGGNAVANTLGVTSVFGACLARSFRGTGSAMIYV